MARNTKTKTLIYRVLSDSSVPVGLMEVFAQVKLMYPATAFSTVYRIVMHLAREGKVTKSDWRDRGSKYEWADREHHHHVLCDGCGDVQDISDEAAGFRPDNIARETGYTVAHHTIEISGMCADCSDKK